MPPNEKELSHLLDDSDVLASNAALRSIVARSQRYRERRLRVVTATAIVLALASVSFAGITGANSGTNSASGSPAKKNASPFRQFAAGGSSWTKQHRALGAAPKGLRWSTASEANSKAASPTAGSASSKSSAAAPAFCTVDGCPGYLPYPSAPRTVFSHGPSAMSPSGLLPNQ